MPSVDDQHMATELTSESVVSPDELDWVRYRMSQLVDARNLEPFFEWEQAEYDELGELELVLISSTN